MVDDRFGIKLLGVAPVVVSVGSKSRFEHFLLYAFYSLMLISKDESNELR